MTPDEEPDAESLTRTSRHRFLRQLGMTAAAAIGAGAFARSIFAASGNCCPNSSCGTCQANGKSGMFCYCDCSRVGSQSYCTSDCITSGGGCQSCPC